MSETQLPETPLTPRQEASRRNGAKSRGPVTPEGKEKSSANAAKHGLFVDKIILRMEDADAFHDELARLVEKYRPADKDEEKLVVNYAINQWRLERIWELEACAVDLHAVDVAAKQPATGPRWTLGEVAYLAFDAAAQSSRFFANIGLYEARLSRASARAKRQLDALLAAREAAQPSANPVVDIQPQRADQKRKNEPTAVPQSLPGSARNRPCPCGSGQKYKRCCLLGPARLPTESQPRAA